MDNSKTNLPIRERIKTFEDAREELGKEHPFVMAYADAYNALGGLNDNVYGDILAFLKLRIICAALNEGWTINNDPTLNDNVAYIPFFRITDIECVMTDNSRFTWLVIPNEKPNHTCFKYEGVQRLTIFPKESPMLHLKSQELAEYCGKQFIDLWADFYLIRK